MADPFVIPISIGMVQAFLIRGERAVLVDTLMPGNAPRIVQALADQGLAPSDLALILITHAHADHVGSAAALKALTGAPIAIHAADAAYLKAGDGPALQGVGWAGKLMAGIISVMPQRSEPISADIVFDGELDLAPYGVAGRVIPTPGHTYGSVSVTLDSGDVLVGDLLRGGWVGKDRPKMPYLTYDLAEVKRSIAKIAALQPRKIYTAHGGPFEPSALNELLK